MHPSEQGVCTPLSDIQVHSKRTTYLQQVHVPVNAIQQRPHNCAGEEQGEQQQQRNGLRSWVVFLLPRTAPSSYGL